MENLIVNLSPELVYYPRVDFNYESGICEIAGESYMEETYKFYEPLITWLQKYTAEKKPLMFNVRLTYFNTSSSRFILEIFLVLKKYIDQGGDVMVNWYYKQNDPEILGEINDFKEEAGIEINTVVVK